MGIRRSLGISGVLALLLGTVVISFAQDRPRYSSSQNVGLSGTVPEGTIISMRLDRTLNSRTSRVGDRFTATVTTPVIVDGNTVIPAGSIIEGRITEVTPAKRMSKSGTIALDFDEIVLPNGFRARLVGSLTSDDPEARRRIDDEGQVSGDGKKKAVFVGGGGAIGAVLGGIAGGGKGAVLGGVAGAGAGVAAILLSKGEEAEVPAGTPFGVQLRQSIVINESSSTAGANGDNDPQPAADGRDSDRDPGEARRSARRDRERNAADGPPVDARDRERDPADARPGDPRDREPVDVRPGDSGRGSDSDADSTRRDPPAETNLPLSSPEMIGRAQTALKDLGYYEGQADGQIGPRTATALKAFQREHNLPETGNLDPDTAKALGIVGSGSRDSRSAPPVPGREAGRGSRSTPARETADNRTAAPVGASDAVLANVLSAIANRAADGAIIVVINTQGESAGWRWFGEHAVNGDTLEVYARAVRPSGITTQVITRGRIELNIDEGVQYVRRVVVHTASGDLTVPLRTSAGTVRDSSPPPEGRDTSSGSGGRRSSRGSGDRDSSPSSRDRGYPPSSSDRDSSSPSRERGSSSGSGARGSSTAPSAAAFQRQAEDLLAEYQRMVGIRLTGAGLELDPGAQRGEAEIELLFALDSFANAAQLYGRLVPSLRDQQGLRSAALALAREARRSDRIFSTTTSRTANALTPKWDAIREDILKLMERNSIKSADLDF